MLKNNNFFLLEPNLKIFIVKLTFFILKKKKKVEMKFINARKKIYYKKKVLITLI